MGSSRKVIGVDRVIRIRLPLKPISNYLTTIAKMSEIRSTDDTDILAGKHETSMDKAPTTDILG